MLCSWSLLHIDVANSSFDIHWQYVVVSRYRLKLGVHESFIKIDVKCLSAFYIRVLRSKKGLLTRAKKVRK